LSVIGAFQFCFGYFGTFGGQFLRFALQSSSLLPEDSGVAEHSDAILVVWQAVMGALLYLIGFDFYSIVMS